MGSGFSTQRQQQRMTIKNAPIAIKQMKEVRVKTDGGLR
jgi:hypothetical protein